MFPIEAPKELKVLIKQFLCAVPVNNLSWNIICEDFSWEKQEILLNFTVGFEPVLTHPIKVSYQREFLKYCMNKLEQQGSDVHDKFYEHYGRLVALPDHQFAHKHYLLNRGDLISLKENINFISEGTTGLCTWQAAIVLAEWSVQNSSLLRDKIVLELGSGVGLTGISAILHSHPSRIFLTDCHSSVLSTLCENINLTAKINDINLENIPSKNLFDPAEFQTKFLQTFVHVLNLPWGKVNEEVVEAIDADLVLAADVVYDKDLFEDLVEAVRLFLGKKGAKVVFACTERNLETLELFLETLERESLSYETLPIPEQTNFFWAEDPPVRLFSVFKE